MLGLAAGDALGATVEFEQRGDFEPMTDIFGGGPHRLEAGQWTDDTSMALCLAESLIEKGGMDLADQLERYADYSEGPASWRVAREAPVSGEDRGLRRKAVEKKSGGPGLTRDIHPKDEEL